MSYHNYNNDHIFVKSLPKKKKTKKRSEPMTPFEESIRKETIVDRNTDLAKLLFTIKLIKEWPQDIDLKTFVVKKVMEFFDGSGEVATQNCLEVSQEYGFIVLETDPKTGDKRYVLISFSSHKL